MIEPLAFCPAGVLKTSWCLLPLRVAVSVLILINTMSSLSRALVNALGVGERIEPDGTA